MTAPQIISKSRADEACYYLQCPGLPVNNYTGSSLKSQPNNVVGLISLKERSSDLYYPSELKTPLYVDIHNTSDISYNSLQFRITDRKGADAKDILPYTILTLEVRQNPEVHLRELFRGLITTLADQNRASYKAAMLQPEINDLGQ